MIWARDMNAVSRLVSTTSRHSYSVPRRVYPHVWVLYHKQSGRNPPDLEVLMLCLHPKSFIVRTESFALSGWEFRGTPFTEFQVKVSSNGEKPMVKQVCYR